MIELSAARAGTSTSMPPVLVTVSLSSELPVPVTLSWAELISVPFYSTLVPARLMVPVSVTMPPSIELVSLSVSVPVVRP